MRDAAFIIEAFHAALEWFGDLWLKRGNRRRKRYEPETSNRDASEPELPRLTKKTRPKE